MSGCNFCRVHTRYNRRVNTAKPISETDLPRLRESEFWANVEAGHPNDCWPWLGLLTGNGYGRHFAGEDEYRAHRVAFALGKDTALPGVVMVCHRCDNPRCVNPGHLFIGMATDNNRDAVAKGRHVTPRAKRNGNGKLSDEQVGEVLSSKEAGTVVARRLGVSPALVCMIRKGQRRQLVGTAGVEPATFRV